MSERKCKAVLHGGVGHRKSTPHKSGNKVKRKTMFASFYGIVATNVFRKTVFCRRLSRMKVCIADGTLNTKLVVKHRHLTFLGS